MATFNLFWNNYSLPNYIPSLCIYNQAVKRSSFLQHDSFITRCI